MGTLSAPYHTVFGEVGHCGSSGWSRPAWPARDASSRFPGERLSFWNPACRPGVRPTIYADAITLSVPPSRLFETLGLPRMRVRATRGRQDLPGAAPGLNCPPHSRRTTARRDSQNRSAENNCFCLAIAAANRSVNAASPNTAASLPAPSAAS